MVRKIIQAVVETWYAGAFAQSLVNNAGEVLISLGSLVAASIAGIWAFCTSKKLKKYEAEMQKQIDKADSINERLTHINNNQYDYKFEICKSISETSFLMCHCCCKYLQLVLMEENVDEKKEVELFEKVEDSIYSYRDVVFKYAAFLPKALLETFEEFIGEGWAFVHLLAMNRENEFVIDPEIIDKHYNEMVCSHRKLTASLREYLEKMARGENGA